MSHLNILTSVLVTLMPTFAFTAEQNPFLRNLDTWLKHANPAEHAKDIAAFFLNPDLGYEDFNDAFALVARFGREEIIEALLKEKIADLESSGVNGALYQAARFGHTFVLIKLLVNEDVCNLISPKSFVSDIVTGAMLNNQARALSLLLGYPLITQALSTASFNYYLPTLGRKKFVAVVQVLFNHKATRKLITKEGLLGLMRAAAAKSDDEMIRFIIERPANHPIRRLLDTEIADKTLIKATQVRCFWVVQLLLNNELTTGLISRAAIKQAIRICQHALYKSAKGSHTWEAILGMLKKHLAELSPSCVLL